VPESIKVPRLWLRKEETSITELCRLEGIVSNLYYRWKKDFLEAGKNVLIRTWYVKRPIRK
jgi:transposase-like protein